MRADARCRQTLRRVVASRIRESCLTHRRTTPPSRGVVRRRV